MGIVHFATVGTSPGAVTSPLAYLQKHPEVWREESTGSIVESVVVFCSPEVERGERLADDYIWNSYGQESRRQGWDKPRSPQYVLRVIQQFLTDDRYGVLLDAGNLYVWPIDVQDYDACFQAIAQATLAMVPPNRVGKFVWANLTGGTNVVNAALMQVALLSGLIGRLYYAFIADSKDRQYLLPPSEDLARYRIDFIPLVKTDFDTKYYRVLEILQEQEWWDEQELYEFLKTEPEFEALDLSRLRNQFLLRMSGRGEIERQEDRVRLSKKGREILARIHQPLFEALVKRGQDVSDQVLSECRQALKKCLLK